MASFSCADLDDEVKPGFVSSVASPAVQPQREVRITDVPYPVVLRMCMLLDVESFLGNDYRMLAALLGLDNRTIGHLKMTISPSEVILTRIFPTMFNPGTLDCLIAILTKMERYDVIHVIDEWVDSQTCTQGAQDN